MSYADPEKARAYQRRWYQANKERANAKSRAWRRANPRGARSIHLRYAYGIEQDDFEMMLVRQRGACKLCGAWEPGGRNGQWHVDHDHATGRVRGLLCDRCNRGIGFMRDDPALMRAAADYVERYA